MGYGDEILAAGQAERYYQRTALPSLIVDKHDRPRWHPIWEGNPAIVKPSERMQADTTAPYRASAINVIRNGPHIRPYYTAFSEQAGWTFNRQFRAREHVARIYLTCAEENVGLRTRVERGRYVLFEPWSKHENLRWPERHWQALVNSRPDLTFVQHIHESSVLILAPNVFHVRATFREAVSLVKQCDVYIRGESGMLHAAAAVGATTLAIWGGCMDWDVLGGYPKQHGVGVHAPACGSWKTCAHCAQIMASITPDEVGKVLDEIRVK